MNVCQNCGTGAEEDLFCVKRCKYPERIFRSVKEDINVCKRCLSEQKERYSKTRDIYNSNDNKIIIAGPGTGKTHTFIKYLKKFSQSDSVRVTTFINNLVDDLKKEIKKEQKNNKIHASVITTTFHKFCNELLEKIKPDLFYYPCLTEIILDDYAVINNINKKEIKTLEKKLSKNLHNFESTNLVKFYFERGIQYNAVGDDNVAFGLLKELRKDNSILKNIYDEIIVDEYQDFNYAESEIIKLISEHNKILIAGDDDQVLYIFKHSHPKYIREIWYNPKFKQFTLPFCNRCTEVIVDSFNKFIQNLKQLNKKYLSDRIPTKDFKCYFPGKFKDSNKYQYIYYYKTPGQYESTMIRIISKKIKDLSEQKEISMKKDEERINFLILLPKLRMKCKKSIKDKLSDELKKNKIECNFMEPKTNNYEDLLSIEKGYSLVQKNEKSNLGWRIILKNDRVDSIDKILKESHKNRLIFDLLGKDYKEKHLRQIHDSSEKERKKTVKNFGKINIMFSSFCRAKGLSADHVFILFLQDEILPEKKGIEEEEIFQFLVGLTRAKKSLTIINQYYKAKSAFIDLLPKEKIYSRNIQKNTDDALIK